MRLFIAVCFEEEIKDSLQNVTEQLKNMSLHGNFTKRDNLHLTLHFIGETSAVSALKNAMNSVDFPEFNLHISKCGTFRSDVGDIYWMGLDESEPLLRLYSDLGAELRKHGFKTENRAFRPHLTLGREVIIGDGFDKRKLKTDESVIKVNSIHLMKSERINGRLVYTSIYEKKSNM